MKHFSPHLEILPAPQRALWNELSEYPENSCSALDLDQMEQGISFLKGANVIQRDKNKSSVIVDRAGQVKVSFFHRWSKCARRPRTTSTSTR